MADLDASQIYRTAMPLIAVVLMASGILVKTVPLESRRPADPQRVAFAPAGRQDIEARLWDDPFAVMRGIKGQSPAERCEEAKKDRAHQPGALHGSIAFRAARERAMSVLAVMVPGGPYFEDGEARRRSRYAVVSGLLETGWTPASEDKLGFIWTLESCIEQPWKRYAPELLPYEWFRFNGNGEGRRELLVLWVDESALSSRPLKGMERIVERLAKVSVPCKAEANRPVRSRDSGACFEPRTQLEVKEAACRWPDGAERSVDFGDGKRPPPWCDTRVIGPSTSGTLHRLVREVAPSSGPATTADWLRFYSSGATAALDVSDFQSADAQRRFAERVVRLTATDDRLASALADELRRRLVDPTPFWRIRHPQRNPNPLCASTVVLVSEGDTSYAREFQSLFTGTRFGKCPKEAPPRVVAVRYLRGLDGVLPVGSGAPVQAAAGQSARTQDARDSLLDPAALERADGRSQYDYLRRLAQQLGDYDREEKRAGRNGIRGVGVLGNDTYDKLLVLDALRERFPDAVFFAADLDARLINGGAVRSTRNLVVASAYGLALNPDIQGGAPPFRDTYQTGNYFATRVALDPKTAGLSTREFARWFKDPQLFEIGRARAVPLSKGATERCDAAKLMECRNIHAMDEWVGATPYPGSTVLLALAAMTATAVALALMLSQGARKLAARIRQRASSGRAAIAGLLVLALVSVAGLLAWAIWADASSGQGEPFAWFEGVSIWPTQILRLAIFVLTIALFAFGRWQLHRRIDNVAGDFGLVSLTERAASPLPKAQAEAPQASAQPDPWTEYLDRTRLRTSSLRIALTAALFFAFSVALASLDWPHSPHRGELAAWSNHLLLLLLLGAMTALLFAALDASRIATRLLARLHPGMPVPTLAKPDEPLLRQYPVGERALELWGRFRLAVRVASEVNGFVYLPFLTILLIIPTQSRVFDAWDLSLPFAALLAISFALAALCARQLRRAAARLKSEILDDIEAQAQHCEASRETGSGPQEAPPELKAKLLRRIAEQIRAVRDGPFLPLSQEPAVRAILLVLGGAGGISTAEFLFLSRG